METIRGITINTDASFHPHFKTAGFAFYIVCDAFKIKQAGTFVKHPPKTSEEAEMMCIGNAIARLLKVRPLPNVSWIVVNTDCKNAITNIVDGSTTLGLQINQLWKKLLKETECSKGEFRYVKAHTGADNARSYVNAWCDKWAKQEMWTLTHKSFPAEDIKRVTDAHKKACRDGRNK